MTVIRFDNVTKKYRLRHRNSFYLRDTVTHALSRLNPFRSRNGAMLTTEDFWALKDVSFEVKQGESVGIIGPNGAGKSTALKLLAGISRPTSGSVSVEGRIGALIEVSAGFHPELTGRENVYLNGSILGMKRKEIDAKFGEIVSFAGIEPFIDTPVKNYSSGMYVRLGFAVAIHSDPELLLIDEVLSVGDMAFQKKCLDRMAAFQKQGVTLVFVSHALPQVGEICQRGIYLNDGQVRVDGPVDAAISTYTRDVRVQGTVAAQAVQAPTLHENGQTIRITHVTFRDTAGDAKNVFKPHEGMVVEIGYDADQPVSDPVFGIGLFDANRVEIVGFNTLTCRKRLNAIEGEGVIRCRIPSLPLQAGAYFISVAIHDLGCNQIYDYHERRYPLDINAVTRGERGILSISASWDDPIPTLDTVVGRHP